MIVFFSFFIVFSFIVTNGAMHFFRRRGHAHVRLQTDTYAYSNLGPYPNSEPVGSFHQQLLPSVFSLYVLIIISSYVLLSTPFVMYHLLMCRFN
jgi:hypothetical protein